MAGNTKKHLQKAFIAVMSQTGKVSAACAAVGIDRETHYNWMRDPVYNDAIKEARAQAGDLLEEEARRRAHDGYERPIYQGGRKVGTETVYSDALMIRLLQANLPQRYETRSAVKHLGPDGGPMAIEYPQLKALSDEQLEQLRAIQLTLAAAGGAGPGDSGEEEAQD